MGKKLKGLTKLGAKLRSIPGSIEKKRADALGMTVAEYRQHKADHRKALAKEKATQKEEYEKWRITQKYTKKKADVISGKKGLGLLGALKTVSRNVNENITRGMQTQKPRTQAELLEDMGLGPKKKTKKKKKKVNPFIA